MTEEINLLYTRSYGEEDTEDSLHGVLGVLRRNPVLLSRMVASVLWEVLGRYVFLCGKSSQEEIAEAVELARATPETFGVTLRNVIWELKNREPQHFYDTVFKWLEQNHPEALEDALTIERQLENEDQKPFDPRGYEKYLDDKSFKPFE